MRPIGYMYKRVSAVPHWLNAPHVADVYALSGCVSENFADYINFWRHNGYWLFDSATTIRSPADEHTISLEGLRLFYYEAHDLQYDEPSGKWVPFEPEPSFETNVQPPTRSSLEGFDVTTFYAGTSPECSPLSCNSLAADIVTNSHCLFPTFEAAVRALEEGRFKNSEPGPYRIIGVYSVHDA
jgi:hypothetical protein